MWYADMCGPGLGLGDVCWCFNAKPIQTCNLCAFVFFVVCTQDSCGLFMLVCVARAVVDFTFFFDIRRTFHSGRLFMTCVLEKWIWFFILPPAWFAKPCAVAIDKASLAMMFGPECCSVLEKREIAGLQGATGRMAGSLTTCDNSGGDWNSRMVNFPKVFCSSPQPCEFSGQVESLGRPVNPIRPVVHVAPQVWPWVRSWSQAGTCNYLSQEKIIGKVNLAKKEAHETDILSKYAIGFYREFVHCTVYLHAQHPRHVCLHFSVETGKR